MCKGHPLTGHPIRGNRHEHIEPLNISNTFVTVPIGKSNCLALIAAFLQVMGCVWPGGSCSFGLIPADVSGQH